MGAARHLVRGCMETPGGARRQTSGPQTPETHHQQTISNETPPKQSVPDWLLSLIIRSGFRVGPLMEVSDEGPGGGWVGGGGHLDTEWLPTAERTRGAEAVNTKI